jgi:RHS repeat-associated protein
MKTHPAKNPLLSLVCCAAAKGVILATILIAMPASAQFQFESEVAVIDFPAPDIQELSNTGASFMKIPIVVPPGRKGVQPELNLIYHSFNRNGWAGYGWSIDLPAIQRATRKGVDYNANDYILYSNGIHEELVDRASEWGANHYGKKIENEFTKYAYDPERRRWQAYSKKGVRFSFGDTESSRQTTPGGVFKWLLDRVEDSNGNFMSINYAKDEGQIYPQSIIYTGNASTGDPGFFQVEFVFEDRPDPVISWKTQSEEKTTRRLEKIAIYAGSQLARTYAADYEIDAVTGSSRLSSLSVFGSDGRTPMPPFKFNWRPSHTGSFGAVAQQRVPGNYETMAVYLAEVNGDGRADIVYTSPTRLLHRISNGDGTFTSVDVNRAVGDDAIIGFADVNGDGLSDIIKYKIDELLEYYYVGFSEGSGRYRKEIATRISPTSIDPGAKAYFADINGDGLSDLVFLYEGQVSARLSNGDGTFRRKDSRIRSMAEMAGFADINGDGMADLVQYRNEYSNHFFYTYFSKGDGSFAASVRTKIPGDLEDAVKPHFGDVNGDGLADIILKSEGRFYVKLSRGDGTYTAGPDGNTKMGRECFGFADVNGDGLDDMIGASVGTWAYGDIWLRLNEGRAMPNLLAEAVDVQGGRTEFSYRPSTFYANGHLPFSFPILAALRIDDGLGNVAEIFFDYEGGRFDPAEREFRGFERIEKIQPDGSRLISRFHLDRFRRGKPYQIDLMTPGESPALLIRTTQDWEPGNPDEAGTRHAFVRSTRKKIEYLDSEPVFYQEENTYDEKTGNLTRLVRSGSAEEETAGAITEFAYQNYGAWCWRKTRETLKERSQTVLRDTDFVYQPGTGNLRTVRYHFDGSFSQVEYRQDIYGNPVEYHDAAGNAPWTASYDAQTHTLPVEIMNPLGHATRYEWDLRYGSKTAVADANLNVTRYGYDPFGREVSISYPDQGQVLREYYDCSEPACTDARVPRLVVQKRLERQNEQHFISRHDYFDGLGRNIQTVTSGENGRPIVSKAHYDAMGRKHLSEGPFFSAQIGYPAATPESSPYRKTEFDYRGRPIRIHAPLGESAGSIQQATTHIAYSGFSKTTTDPDGGKKTEILDCLNRLIRVQQYLDGRAITTAYSYNAAGDLLSIANALGHTTVFGYDGLGRKKSMNDPDLGLWAFDYDANNNLIATTRARGHTIRIDYDALNRPVARRYSNSDPTVSYHYDNAAIPNGIGRLYKIENNHAATVYKAYDQMGRVSQVSRRIAGAPQPEYDTAYTYDAAGRLTGMVYPDGYRVGYAYHPGTELIRYVFSETGAIEFAEIDSYTADNRMGFIYHGNGCATAYGYDEPSGRLTSLRTQDPFLNDIQSKRFSYSPAGDLLKITAAEGDRTITYQYAYDELHRLIQETNNAFAESFQPAVLDTVYDGSPPLHAPKATTAAGSTYVFAYDADGNMTTGYDLNDPQQPAIRKIEFNADNLPTTVEYRRNGATMITRLAYDGENRRVKKILAGGETTFYVGDHYEVAGSVGTKYVFASGLRLAAVKGTTPYFFHKDHLGSSTALTAFSDGKAIERADYLPYGLVRRQAGFPSMKYTFTDQEFDAASGLYNFKARLYDPSLGIFISPDNVVPDYANPQSLNPYSYCYNNPLIHIDPDGHWVVGATIGAISGGISGLMAGIALGGENLDAAIFGGIVGAIAGAIVGGSVGAIGLYGSSSPAAIVAVNTIGGIAGTIAGNQVGKGITMGHIASKSGSGSFMESFLSAAVEVDAVEIGMVSAAGAISGFFGGLTTVAVGTAKGGELAVSLVAGSMDTALGILHGFISTFTSDHAADMQAGNSPSDDSESSFSDLGVVQ